MCLPHTVAIQLRPSIGKGKGAVWVTGPFANGCSRLYRFCRAYRGWLPLDGAQYRGRAHSLGALWAGRNDKGFGHGSLSLLFLAELLLISLSRSASESFCERKQLIQFSRSKRGHNTERLLPLFEPWRNTRL